MSTSIRPLQRRIQARIFRVLNIFMRGLLSLPISTPPGRRLMLVHYTGRRTGKSYRQPVSFVRDADGTLLTPGGGRWTLNLRNGQPVVLQIRGQRVTARPDLIEDVDAVDQLLQVMKEQNRMLRRFVPIPAGPDGRHDRPALENAIRHGFRIVRWHLDRAAAPRNAGGGRGRVPAPAAAADPVAPEQLAASPTAGQRSPPPATPLG